MNTKKIIVIGTSMKFRQIAKNTLAELEKLGFQALFPNIDCSTENRDVALNTSEKAKLAWEHYRAIEAADAVYFILPNGYMGTSCKVELGYALAMKKTIYFSELTNEPDLDCYVKQTIALNNLAEFKNEFI